MLALLEDRERPDRARLDLAQGAGGRADIGLDPTAQQRDQRLAGAAGEGNRRDLHARGLVELLHHQVRLAVFSGDRRADLARILSDIGHELVEGLPRRIGAHDQVDVLVHQLDDRLIVVRLLEREARDDQGLEPEDRVGPEADGVAVRLGPNHDARADRPRSPRFVFNVDVPVQLLLQLTGELPGDGIGPSPGVVGHDEGDVPARVVLRPRFRARPNRAAAVRTIATSKPRMVCLVQIFISLL